jgi:CubicO group peptidase (beta-lactamase class C family)
MTRAALERTGKNLSLPNLAFRLSAGLMATLLLVTAVSGGALAAPTAGLGRSVDAAGPTDPEELEIFIDGLMAAHLQAYHIPGATVAVVKDDALLFAKGYGYADLEERAPVDAEQTLFRPGSVSKLFTWTAVMQLVEVGELELDVDVNQYLDFEIPATYPEPITLAHLLTHTPGFEDQGQGLFVLEEDELVSLEEYVKISLPARVYPPGEVSAYSNYGTALAGYIVQRVSDTPFEAYVEERIFEPLGMARSTFRQPLPPALAEDMAGGYGYTNGAFLRGGFEFIAGMPAGSMSSSATDMAHFMIAHLQSGRYEGEQMLAADTVAAMHATQYTPDPRSGGIGYGFFRDRVNGRPVLKHEGDTFLFHTGFYLLPGENGSGGVGLYVSYNSLGGSKARTELLEAFVDRYFPAPVPEPVEPPVDFESRMDAYTGEYHLARANYSTAEKILALFQPVQVAVGPEGQIILSVAGQQPEQHVEVEPWVLQQTRGEDRVIFFVDEKGRVTGAVPADTPPFTMFKAPWYATVRFTVTLLVGGLVLFLLTLLGWVVAYFTTRAHDRDALPPRWARVARWVTTAFVLVTLVFLIGLFSVMGSVNPTYGVPDAFFGVAPGLDILMALTTVSAALAAGMLVMTVVAWWQRYWGWLSRIWYSLLTVVGLSWVWMLAYWNLLGPGF